MLLLTAWDLVCRLELSLLADTWSYSECLFLTDLVTVYLILFAPILIIAYTDHQTPVTFDPD